MGVSNTHSCALPIGVSCRTLTRHDDSRGWFAELFRDEWDTGYKPVQWNLALSNARTLRGMHLHLIHWDYLVVPSGSMLLNLKDLRAQSPTRGLVAAVTLNQSPLTSWIIPPGVAHGFYFPEPSMHVYSVSEYWCLADELGCRWDDPDLGVTWPDRVPTLSERDRNAPSYAELMDRIAGVDFPIQTA